MNIKARFPGFKVWSRAQGDIDRVLAIWKDCFERYGGPFLCGNQPCIADAMYAPVVTACQRLLVLASATPRIAVEEEIPQPAGNVLRVRRPDVEERGRRAIQHGALLGRRVGAALQGKQEAFPADGIIPA